VTVREAGARLNASLRPSPKSPPGPRAPSAAALSPACPLTCEPWLSKKVISGAVSSAPGSSPYCERPRWRSPSAG
jgi:hypothetical protein